ncbi:hypothetical protein E1301_Tti019603 [Triplophysa tibetana]|uniref:Uncharacterized protein n=1 Tax=Triplophysa tibetana TaxID=1572043 RepID=A0A5A9N7K0_9TELE|nr:hypothetical protein E1301_Tti019603 [Triplophysa tibetana]
MRIYYVCEQCNNVMSSELENVHCVQCNITHEDTNRSTKNCFIYLSLEYQIRNLLKMPGITDKLVQRQTETSTSVSDITDGFLYQKALGGSDTPLQTLTLTFSCDGVPVFKKSPCSIWPLLCTINELPEKMRQDNVLLCGLWFGDEKPQMRTFLKPFVDECVKLEDSGFTWEMDKGVSINTKVIPLVLVSDSVARPLIQNFKQFNGEYGCSYCLHKGKMVEKGSGTTRVYPFQENVRLRNQEETDELVESALETDQPVLGVKGPSILCRLPILMLLKDMIKSTQEVALQIVKTCWLQKALPFYGQSIIKDASVECKEFFENLTGPKQLKHVTRTCGVTALDRPKVRLLDKDDYMALNRYGVQRGRVNYFKRIIVNGEVIHSEDYSCVFKRNSFTVMLKDADQSFFSIKRFLICQNEDEMCYAIGRFYERAKHSLCASNPNYFEPVSKHLGHLTAIPASAIKCKCLIIHTEKLKVDYIFRNINGCEFLK